MNYIRRALVALLLTFAATARADDAKPPVRIAVVGLNHDHARGFFPKLKGRSEVELVGIVETNSDLIQIYSKQYNLDSKLFVSSLD